MKEWWCHGCARKLLSENRIINKICPGCIESMYEKEEKKTPKKARNPNIVVTYLQSTHHALCPPVCFIDKIDQENLK